MSDNIPVDDKPYTMNDEMRVTNELKTGIGDKAYSLAERAAQSLEAAEKARLESLSTVHLDGSNIASAEGVPFKLEARGSNILVNVDMFKSGYECKGCNGTGKVTTTTVGKKFVPGVGSVADPVNETFTCPDCKGKGASLLLPDESKSLPTTGVVVSIGADVEKGKIKIGDRVLFGPHSGQFIPLKAFGILFKTMHEREATCFIYGGEGMASSTFVMTDTRLGE